jgi:hypothetical protein
MGDAGAGTAPVSFVASHPRGSKRPSCPAWPGISQKEVIFSRVSRGFRSVVPCRAALSVETARSSAAGSAVGRAARYRRATRRAMGSTVVVIGAPSDRRGGCSLAPRRWTRHRSSSLVSARVRDDEAFDGATSVPDTAGELSDPADERTLRTLRVVEAGQLGAPRVTSSGHVTLRQREPSPGVHSG